jgi:hypothetical protein
MLRPAPVKGVVHRVMYKVQEDVYRQKKTKQKNTKRNVEKIN